MKKILLIILFFITKIFAFAQEAQVLAKDDSSIVSFAYVLYHKNDTLLKGDYGNAFGVVELNYPEGTTHVTFKSMGYKTFKTPVFSISDTIYLEDDDIELETIVLKPNKKNNKKLKTKKLGFPIKHLGCMFSPLRGFEAIAFIENKTKEHKKILSFSFFLRKHHEMQGINDILYFRLVAYSHKDKVPDKAYLRDSKNNIFMTQGYQEGKIKLDIANLKLSLPTDGMFIGLEYLGYIKENEQNITSTNEKEDVLLERPCLSFLVSKNPNAKYSCTRYKCDKNAREWRCLSFRKEYYYSFLRENEYFVPAFGIEVEE